MLEKAGMGLQRSDVYAELVGTATNHDGRSASLLAPSGPAQTAVIRAALAEAGISGDQVSFLETHGTGTKVGDPLEFNAFKEALAPGRTPRRPLHIGAVKSNLGHLEGAAGITGLVKAALVLQHAVAPPNLHFKKLNTLIDTSSFPVVFPTEPISLSHDSQDVLVASVSSWGFGGSNAHAILRRASCTRDAEEIGESPTNRSILANTTANDQTRPTQPGLVAMFTGQGSQSINMARALYRYVICCLSESTQH